MPKIKPITPRDTDAKERFAMKIIEWLAKRELWYEVAIYVNGKCYSADGYDKTKNPVRLQTPKNGVTYYATDVPDPTVIVEYANPDLITMTFEGPLYQALNYDSDTEQAFMDLFDRHGLYFEYGYAWSLSAYEN